MKLVIFYSYVSLPEANWRILKWNIPESLFEVTTPQARSTTFPSHHKIEPFNGLVCGIFFWSKFKVRFQNSDAFHSNSWKHPKHRKKCHVKVTPVTPRHSRKTIEMDISPHVFHMFINFSRLLVCDLEHLGMWTSPAFPSQNHEKTVPRIRTNPLKRTVIYPNSTLKYCNIYIYICVIIYVCIYIIFL